MKKVITYPNNNRKSVGLERKASESLDKMELPFTALSLSLSFSAPLFCTWIAREQLIPNKLLLFNPYFCYNTNNNSNKITTEMIATRNCVRILAAYKRRLVCNHLI